MTKKKPPKKKQEFSELSTSPPEGYTISLAPSETLHTWHLTLRPPTTTPFHPGIFGIVLSLPVDYPFKPPIVKFVTRIYHPNVTNDSLGNVCLAILKPENWKPSTKIAAVLDSIRNLLVEPQPDDPLEERIAHEYRADREGWEANVATYVEKYASKEPEFPPA
ncbi:ubiquitin-conjugating enzyme E2 D [Geosmithia morbida]|uniref:E2 ubiquitin-conjugating enzyme n=1 Tax=Geosmithia morbida TaxID=1094350 RepID=A0A9P4YT27_9HYPO|nr:ubiquitin-conjugating enzyme E2 D [Geosmithia morbida]KAF4122280.1 ubiquitin-conjugating enzyme E2 D [Geosmithia morbida]